MNMRIFPFQVITAFLIAFIMPGLTLVHASSITVSEDITSDTIWEADTVFVDGTITIDRYSTLTIEPGTYVEFQGYYALNVSGKLVAVGSEAEPIIFTVFDTLGFSNLSQPDGAWHGLQFDNRFRTDTCILEFCIIEYGKAITGDFHNVRGGGIRALYDSKLMVSNCTIRNNYSLEGGGGIYMNTSTTTIITHNTIVNNSSKSRAGGLLAWDAKPVITHNIICNNYGTYGGGAVFQSCDAVLANNMIYNNEALSSGGGVYMSTTDLVSINNTICYNKTYYSMSIGDGIGGGICVGAQCDPVFYNDIIWGNESDGDGKQVYLSDFNSETNFYNCNIQDGPDEFGLQLGSVYFGEYLNGIDTLPGFVLPPADTGITSNPLGIDLTLVLGSPCINRGINTITDIYPLETDIVNNRRISYSEIDIGAFEFYKASLDAWGIIDENTTWTADTIKVDCDIDILDTYTLTINPGAIVQFQDPYKIEVHGTLLALGTETDSIVFTIKDHSEFSDITTGNGGWRGIEFLAFATNDSSKILYSRLEYGKRINGTVDYPSGGAIYAASCYRLLISNSIITNNMAETGGGIQCSTSPITIMNSTISHNRAIDMDHGWGGGIFCHGSNINLIGCNIAYNSSPADGGGICVYRCEPSILNCTIKNNTAEAAGGGLYSWHDAHPILTSNIIINNKAGSGGGIYLLSPGYLSRNLISNNHAGGGAGVYAVADEDVVLINNIICNNYADYHAGALVIDAPGTIFRNNTIVNNYAASSNGGIVVNESGMIIENSIIWGNASADDTYQIDIGNIDEFPDITYSNIQGGLESIDYYAPSGYPGMYENNLDSLPRFAMPTAGAGDGFNGLTADWSLLATSASINSGNPITVDPDVLPVDQAGNPRIHWSVIDMGALENQSVTPVITVQPLNYTRCTGDSVRFSVEASDDVFYQWQLNQEDIREATRSSYLIESVETGHDGNYQCIMRNAYDVLYSNPALLRVKLPPMILLQPENTWAEEKEEVTMRVIASGTDPEYQWRRNGVDLPGKIINELSIPESGYEHEGSYDCMISNVCGADTTEPANLYMAPQICMVTVDSSTGQNLVVWEKESTAPILAYNIYRESVAAGIYDHMVSMPYDDLSQFVDTVADPTAQAYIYKITATDMEGSETDIDLCRPHKTIHLLVSTNPELNTTQLAWDRYYGFEYPSYTIYRSDDGVSFDSIHSISANLNSWTDPEASDGDHFYRIAVRKPQPCTPVGGKKKVGTGPYNHSLSNMDDNKLKAGEHPPDTIMLDNHSIDENILPGSLVGRLTTIDDDTLDYHTYHLVSGDGDSGNGSFTLIGNLLVSSTTFDYETQDSYSVRVRSTDKAAFLVENAFVITINDTEEGSGTTTGTEPPDTIELDNHSIDENMLPGSLVGRLTTVDEDSIDYHTYQFVSGDGDSGNGSFTLIGNLLVSAGSFDYETLDSYSVRIRSTDNAAFFVEGVFAITVNDKEEGSGTATGAEPPDTVFMDNYSIQEDNLFGDLIGRLITDDPDTFDVHTYQLTSGTGDDDNAVFTILGNMLMAAFKFDFEDRSQYSIRVRSTDLGNNYIENSFVIHIIDIDETTGQPVPGAEPPEALSLNNNSIPENNLLGDLVGRLVTDDPDTFDVHTYHLVSGSGDDDNAVFMILGDMLMAAFKFDFEDHAQLSVRVRTTDLGHNFIENSFVINITDVDETVGIAELNDGAILAFPNPFSHSTTIRFPNPAGEPYRMVLMDLSGKLVRMQDNITSGEFVLKRNGFEKGLYLIELTGKQTFRGKLVIE